MSGAAGPDEGAGRTGRPVRVVLVDDERLIRAGLQMLLSGRDDVTVVGEAGDGVEAIEVCRRLAPDVVLMDVRMPRMDGIEAVRHIATGPDAPAVLVLTTFGVEAYVRDALAAGASGFLLKDAPEERIVSSILAAGSGVSVLDRTVVAGLVAQRRHTPVDEDPGLASLTARETEVLRRLATGASNDEIARTLVIGAATVKTHVSRVMAKLGVSTRTQAAALAYEHGLVGPGARDG